MTLGQSAGQVGVGRTLTLAAVVVDSNGKDVTAQGSYAWSSSNPAVATVTPSTTVAGAAVVTGIAPGTVNVQVAATINGADGKAIVLPVQSATIAVAASGQYSLAVSHSLLSLAHGETRPIRATLLDGDGIDVSAAVHDWAWASSAAGIQLSADREHATLHGVNASTTSTVEGTVTVGVTAPDGVALAARIAVVVLRNGSYAYTLELLRNGAPIDAISILNGYPATLSARVMRSDGTDATVQFDGQWSYASTSPSLSAQPDASGSGFTLNTGRPNGADPLQSLLKVTATSRTLDATPSAGLTVTEQPAWALVYDGPQPLRITTMPPLPIPVTATVRHRGNALTFLECEAWDWQHAGNIAVTPATHPGQVGVTPLTRGDFSLTASCSVRKTGQRLSVTIAGTAI
ncbi:Ig-like domain-containing protein [Cupriavidus gilardii]|uniref:Ig-like domain-containing protein n=1 Tax=Cupriavidus gilardii TaxID=82541 RepID=UPI00326435FA